MNENITKIHATDHPMDSGHTFHWVLESVPYTSKNLVSRVYRCVSQNRPIRMELTLTRDTVEMVAVCSWVSDGDVENTRKRKATWSHKGEGGLPRYPSRPGPRIDVDQVCHEGWGQVLAVASSKCKPLV